MGQQIVNVHYDYFTRLIHGHGAYAMTTDLPPDARVVAAYPNPERATMRLIMESASWDEVPENHVLPEFAPTVTVTNSELEAVIWAMNTIACPKCGTNL
jgi:hypothetical protein